MDENLHRIDDLFKKAIEEHNEVPSPKVWEDIDKNLDKKKVVSITRKYEKWKWVAAALFIFSVGMAMYSYNLKLRYKEVVKGNKVKSTKTYNENRLRTNEKKNAPDSLTTASNKKQNSAISKTPQSTTAASGTRANNNEHTGTSLTNKNAVATIERKNKQPINLNTNAQTAKKDLHAIVKQNRKPLTAANEQQKIKEPVASAGINQNDNSGRDITINSGDNNRNKISSAIVDSSNNTPPSANKFEVETAIVSERENFLRISPPVIPSNAMSNILAAPTVSAAATKVSGNLKGIKPTKNTVSIFFSPGIVSTRLQNDRQHFREDDRREIKQNENNNYTYTIGALVERNIGGNFSIFSGLSLATRITETNSKTLYARPDDRGNVNYRISCSAGYAYISTKRAGGGGGNRPSAGDTIKALSATTTLQYLSVPAGLRYHFNMGKFSFNPAVGLSANFITEKKIETVLFAAGGNENTTTSDIQGLRPAYFDGSLRTDFVYNLNRTIGISLMPSARFALSSITRDGPVKTYVNTFGLGLGLNIHF